MPHGLGGDHQTLERTLDADSTATGVVVGTRRTPQHTAARPGAPALPHYPRAGPPLPGAEAAPSSTMDSSPLPPKPHRQVGSTHSFNQTSARARRTAALTQGSNAASLGNTPVPVSTSVAHSAFSSLAWPGAEGASASLSRQWPDPQLLLTPADGSSPRHQQPSFPRQPTALAHQHTGSTSSSLGGRHSWSGSLSIMLGMLPSPSSTPRGPLTAMPAPSTSSTFDPLSPQPHPPQPSFPYLVPSWSSTGGISHGPHAHATPRASATGLNSLSPFALAAVDHSGPSVSTTSATSTTTAHHRAAGSTSTSVAHGNHSNTLQPHASHPAALQSGGAGGGPQRKPSKDDWAPLPLPLAMAVPPPAQAAKASLARVLAVSFWPAPLAALLFALAMWVGGLGGWEVSLPGAQALFLMCWLQCCWFFLSHSGAATGPRAVLRYGQLAAAALGVAMLLPGSGWYGSSLVGSSITGIAGEYDTAYGSVTGSTPGSGGVSYTLLWQMGIGAAKGGSWAGSGSGAGAGVESLVDADVHHELIRLQIALGVVLGVWVLQLVLVAASPRLTHIAAVAGTAFRGRPGPRLSRFRPDFSADGTARSKDAAAAADQEEGGEPYDSTTLPLTPNKSHLDLSSLQHLNLELQHGTSAPYSGVRQGPFGFQPVSAAALASAGPPATCVDCLSAACFPACAPRATPAPGPGTPQPAQLGLKRLRWWCGGRGAPVSLAGAVAALPAAAQRLLLWVAVAAQVVAAGLLVDATEPPAERLALSQGVAISSAPHHAEALRRLYRHAALSWTAVAALAAAMAAPLLLPALLQSRPLPHTALLLRPAASRGLGLQLVDWNCAKGLVAFSLAVAAGWPLGVYGWQLLQVATVCYGMWSLYFGALRHRQQQLLSQQHQGLMSSGSVAPGARAGGYLSVATSDTGGCLAEGSAAASGQAGARSWSPGGRPCLSVCIPEGGVGAVAADSLPLSSFTVIPHVGLGSVLDGVQQQVLHSSASARREVAAGPLGGAGGMSAATAMAVAHAVHAASSPMGRPASPADTACTASATATGTATDAASLPISPCSSIRSFTSSAAAAETTTTTVTTSMTAFATVSGAVMAMQLGAGHGPGSGCPNSGPGSTASSVAPAHPHAQLARRAHGAWSQLQQQQQQHSLHAAHVAPAYAQHGTRASDGGGTGALTSIVSCPPLPHIAATGSSIPPAPILPPCMGSASGNGTTATASTFPACTSSPNASTLRLRASASAWLRAAVSPWGLLTLSLAASGSLLWVTLVGPPLAVLGDEPFDDFLALADTGPGAAALVVAAVAAPAALLAAAACLAWVGASGELGKRWRSDRLEGRRLQCYAWACGPPLVVAVASALSWALGEQRNSVAFVLAESLRAACLWPLVWLLEPWLLGGAAAVGGCVQHAGCGATCCVLRWAGLRPCGPGVRCDEQAAGAGAGGLRS